MEKMIPTGGGKILWMDWLKVIAIVLMIFGHAPVETGCVRTFVYSFHMPLFFILSGYLYKRRPMSDELRKCFRSLYFPYLVYICFLYIYAIYTTGDELSIARITKLLTGSLENTSSAYSHLWFLPCLISIRLMVASFKKKLLSLVCLLAAVVMLVGFSRFCGCDLFQLQTAILCLPFFVLGMIARKYEVITHPIRLKRWWNALILLGTLIFTTLGSVANGEVDVFRCMTGKSLPIFYLNAVLASLLFIYICRTLLDRSCSFIRTLSEGTLLVLAFHKFFIGKGVEVLGLTDICLTLVLSAFVTCIFYYPIKVIDKFAPFLLGRNK